MNKPQKQRVAVQLARPQSTDQHSNIPSLSRPLHPAAAQDSGDGSHQLSMVLLLYDDDENLVTALVPSLTACFASSPGSMRRTAVWISRLLKVAFLLYVDNFPASPAMRSKISLIKEFMIDMPFLEMPVSGWTCFSTL
jgi:hypothetical protein